MLQNFLFSVGAVFPTFITIFFGYFLKKKKFFTEDFLNQIDRYCFKIALPLLMIRDISDADITTMFSWDFAAMCFFGTSFLFIGYYIIMYPFFKDKKFVSSFVQCCSRGSVAIFGTSIVINIYGSAGVAPLMMAIAVPLYNIYTVILFNLNSESGESPFSARNIKKMIKGVVTNYLIIGIAIGAALSVTHIEIPAIIYKPLSSIAATGTPLALLSLGGSLSFTKIGQKLKITLAACFVKLIVSPCLILPLAAFLGMRNGHLISLMIMSAAPCTVTAYIMAKNMGGDGEFTSASVMLGTLLSTVTFTMWLTVLRTLGLI